MLRPYLIIVGEPPQESVEAAFTAVRILADVVDPRLDERGMQLGARFGGTSTQQCFFGGGRLEEISREREHPARERDVRAHHAASFAAALHPLGEAAGPPQRECSG